MASSIIHRGTGMAMYFGTLLIVLWLGAAALGDGPVAVMNAIFGFWLVQVILFLATWALFHHMLGGIRVLLIENMPWRQRQKEMATAALIVASLAAIVFLARAA